MTNGECIYRKAVDYMSRMALEKDGFSVILPIFIVTEEGHFLFVYEVVPENTENESCYAQQTVGYT